MYFDFFHGNKLALVWDLPYEGVLMQLGLWEAALRDGPYGPPPPLTLAVTAVLHRTLTLTFSGGLYIMSDTYFRSSLFQARLGTFQTG